MTASFTRSVREELARVTDSRRCCRLAEVAALVRTTGSFHIRGGVTEEERYGVHLATTVQSAARLGVLALQGIRGARASFGPAANLASSGAWSTRCIWPALPPRCRRSTNWGCSPTPSGSSREYPARLLKRRCCKAAFLRGCLIGAGSVNPPQSEAHLEILTPHADFAAALVGLLEGLEFHPGSYVRRGNHVVYLKGREEVAELLALAGAQESALQVEVQAVMKDVRARANRLANWDQANLGRTSAAALRQVEAITYLERAVSSTICRSRFARWPLSGSNTPISISAELAAESPDALTRSAANHRLRRLEQAAEAAGWQPRVSPVPVGPGAREALW